MRIPAQSNDFVPLPISRGEVLIRREREEVTLGATERRWDATMEEGTRVKVYRIGSDGSTTGWTAS